MILLPVVSSSMQVNNNNFSGKNYNLLVYIFPGPDEAFFCTILLILPGTKKGKCIDQGHKLGHGREFLFPMHSISKWFVPAY